MKKTNYLFLALLMGVFCTFLSCNKDKEEQEFIDPEDIEALSRVLIMPDATNRNSGNPPAPSGTTEAPTVSNPISVITSSNGSTAPLEFLYGNTSDDLVGCYIQIPGSSSYFTVPYNQNAGTSGSLAVPIGIPTNVLGGSFNLNFCVYDDEGLVSNVVSTQINVLKLGTGALQVSLSWNTATDQDLYVVDPNSETIYYSNKIATSGGQLDRDDTDGFGPENIFWLENAPDGEYKVSVNDYDGTSFENTVYVTVNAPEKSKRFTATTINGSTAEIVTIRKSGNNYDF